MTEEYTLTNATQDDEISFSCDHKEILKLTADGFYYKGEVIDDAGAAYALFSEWLRTATTEHTKEETDKE